MSASEIAFLCYNITDIGNGNGKNSPDGFYEFVILLIGF